MEFVVETENLSKSFGGRVTAVSALDLRVRRGAVYGLIGRNGAGKTTTLRLLLGLLRPDAGSARLLGADFWQAPRQVRQKVAYVSQVLQLPAWMRLEDLTRSLGHFYDAWDQDLARDLAKRWEIPWTRSMGRLSGGQQRQAAILLALAARPEVLLLDEPAAGLDPVARRALLREVVDAVSRYPACTILFSTHLISDLERVADHIGIMDRGRLTTSVRLDELLQTTRRVQVIFDDPAPPADFGIPGAWRTQVAGPVVTALVRFSGDGQLHELRERPGVRLNVFPVGLEEIFISLYENETWTCQ